MSQENEVNTKRAIEKGTDRVEVPNYLSSLG